MNAKMRRSTAKGNAYAERAALTAQIRADRAALNDPESERHIIVGLAMSRAMEQPKLGYMPAPESVSDVKSRRGKVKGISTSVDFGYRVRMEIPRGFRTKYYEGVRRLGPMANKK